MRRPKKSHLTGRRILYKCAPVAAFSSASARQDATLRHGSSPRLLRYSFAPDRLALRRSGFALWLARKGLQSNQLFSARGSERRLIFCRRSPSWYSRLLGAHVRHASHLDRWQANLLFAVYLNSGSEVPKRLLCVIRRSVTVFACFQLCTVDGAMTVCCYRRLDLGRCSGCSTCHSELWRPLGPWSSA
jgi:hypothetical protein